MQHGRVEAPCQGHRCDRYARLLARTYCFGFKMRTMGSSTSTAGIDQVIRSIHANAYLLS
jgi:hypothetical protein